MRFVVSGPTASGKSDLALKLAIDLRGEVINADSVQVYRGLDIGSAKPSSEERSCIPHHLFDIRDPDVNFSAGDFVREANRVLDDIRGRQVLPVIVGGTTLYLSALITGLSDLPAADLEIRRELEEVDSSTLHDMLRSVDGVTADRLHPNDKVRVVRAIEVYRLTGRPMSELSNHEDSGPEDHTLIIVLIPDRQKLYEKINVRSDAMVRTGIIQETQDVMRRYGDDAFPLKSLGYAQAREFLKGDISSEIELTELIALQTRNYAKRQMTFWRQEPSKRGWTIFPAGGDDAVVRGNEPVPGMKKQNTAGYRVFDFSYESLLTYLQKRMGESVKCEPRVEVVFVAGG